MATKVIPHVGMIVTAPPFLLHTPGKQRMIESECIPRTSVEIVKIQSAHLPTTHRTGGCRDLRGKSSAMKESRFPRASPPNMVLKAAYWYS
ncbi:hypothetical protein CEXT_529251 [Caerostris extrusa]|uniref:Uncharacterized protein n=1 Tax=Caerostris extrusa TaxID=172846 RepID=A0AAV4S6D4_CAEEX|nr:hypothetical protein CEXT_529251 [Caerostris extrusa]